MKKDKRFYLALVIFCLTGQVAWTVENMYFNVFIYKMFHASAADISLMVAASAVAATVTTLLIGALSDKVGKRKIFICGGYVAWGISIWSFSLIRMDVLSALVPMASAASLGVTLTILMDCVMTFFGSSANDACFNAWLTDVSDDTNRGKIEGINAMMPLVSILVVFGGFMSFDLDKAESWVTIFNIIGVVMIVIGVSGFWLVKDVPIRTEENQKYFANIFHGFRPSVVKGNVSLYLTLLCVAVFNISIQIFMPYLILYYTEALGLDNYVLIFAPAIVIAATFTGLYGKVYDTKGFRSAVVPTLLVLMAGYVGLYFFRGTALVFVASLVMMCGYLGTGAMLGAKVRTHTPANKSGMFQGLRIFAQVLIPGVIGPAIGAAVLKNAETIVNNDGTTSFIPNENIFLWAFIAGLFVWLVLIPLFGRRRRPMLHDLYTSRGEALTGTPWTVYPRPQMRRDSYLNLNGEWAFSTNYGEPEGIDSIRVPFCPESKLSGVGHHFPEGAGLTYRKVVKLPEGFNRGRVLLHIGAADQTAVVFVNKKKLYEHRGGYEAFCVDITAVLQEENEIVIICTDDLRKQEFPYGKQVLPEKRGGMWYTPVSGIWQTVWLESVPETYIEKLNIDNRGYSVTISTVPALEGTVTVAGLGEFALEKGSVTIAPEDPHLWSPEDPYLYDFTVEAGEDRVESYFAIRSLEVKTFGKYPRLCLNGKPYFFHGLLDQGYWPDGLFTPAAPECYADDILAMKKLGFNTLRKHIKIEPEEFYYQCDKLGMIVWQDMVNNSDYNFLRDTVLPTVGIQKLNDKNLHKDDNSRREFLREAKAAVAQLGNHPSICCWTIFNEAWGQFDSDAVYEKFTHFDNTRFIDTTSGWFRREKSDVDSRHVYFRKVKLKGDGVKPLVLSEFGGKTYKAEGHLFNPDKSYGYGGCDMLEALNDAVVKLYMKEVLPSVRNGLCAAIYTQVSDVEDEINGLLTYDRKVEKLQRSKMLPVAEALREACK